MSLGGLHALCKCGHANWRHAGGLGSISPNCREFGCTCGYFEDKEGIPVEPTKIVKPPSMFSQHVATIFTEDKLVAVSHRQGETESWEHFGNRVLESIQHLMASYPGTITTDWMTFGGQQ